jgi:putative methylase
VRKSLAGVDMCRDMNPPFGTRQPHVDVEFLRAELGLARVVYSIHKLSTRGFIERWLQEHDAEVERIMTGKMEILHQFRFHTKRRLGVDVDVFRIERT